MQNNISGKYEIEIGKLTMSRELYLGIDMGGTHIKIAVVASKGVIEE
jgi:activator of 2-hydroxyglutaryl-CoA dehydratase